jgi:hypothetical protein
MAERTATSTRIWIWVIVAAIAWGAPRADRAQQAGVVPTVHYGPPACTVGARPPVKSDNADHANTERKDALENSRIVLSDEPLANFGVERYKLLQYGDCTGEGGCYWADLDAQYKRAEAILATQLAAKKPSDKLAIVMDIDETTLTNYCEMRREDFGYIAPLYNEWETSPEAAMAIPGALRFFNKAREAGVAVFFITGRGGIPDYAASQTEKDQTEATARNLQTAGFRGWEGLQLRNGGERSMPTIDYKSEERRRIVLKGYHIIMSLGDQWSDLLGEPQADISIKLPNPFYFIP